MTSEPPKTFDDVIRAVATLEVTLSEIAKAQRALRGDMSTITPRIDALSAEMKVVSAEVRQMGDRLHRLANLLVPLLDEAGILHQATITLQRAVEMTEKESELRAAFARMIDMVESRVQTMHSELVLTIGRLGEGPPQ